jgi:sugar phosphate isomerase/epimerase
MTTQAIAPAVSSRRQFLSRSLGAGIAATAGTAIIPEKLAAVEPPKRSGKPAMRLSLAAYSFRDTFEDPEALDMPKFIDYCADHGLDGTELTSYFFPEDADDAYYLSLKRHAFLRGIAVSGTAVGNNFALPKGADLDQQIADVKHWIDHAAVLGAPHIRVFAGAPKDIDHSLAVKNCIASLEECCDYAGSKGIFLGLENHGGIVAEVPAMLEIINGVKSPWLGVNLDTGNFHTDDPYADLAKVAPWAVNVQVKVEMKPRGATEPLAADLPRLATILRNANYQGFVVLEYEAKEDAFKAVPGYLDQLRKVISA